MTLKATERGDAIRIEYSGTAIQHLAAIGTVPGAAVLAVAGRCGPGLGRLRYRSSGTLWSWQAPGGSFGKEYTITADGDYLLEDGTDEDAWIRIRVATTYVLSEQEADVFLGEVFNTLGPDDVTASEASAGDVVSTTYALANDSVNRIDGLVVWLDASTTGLEISDDNLTWVSPTTEGAGLSLGSVSAAASVALYTRRTIGAGASSDTDVLNLLQLSWTGH